MSCEELPAGVWPEKDPGTTDEYGVDFTRKLTRWRDPGTEYASSVYVRPRIPTGYDYECTTAGRTGQKEPRWSTTLGGTTTDGSAVWTTRATSTSSLTSTVASVVWTPDSAITKAGEALSGQIATANLSGGLDGSDYEVSVAATLADGRVLVKRCILPVRKAVRVCCA